MSNTTTKLEISIVGAGLAGLAAAISCASGGHHVTLYEGAKQLAEIGAGLQITPNASRLLARWGLLEKAEAVCAEPTRQTVHRYADGRILADDKDFSLNIRRKFGNQAPFIDMHRIDLQTMLYDRALELGVTVLFNRKVVQVLHQQDQPVILLDDNTHHPCNLVVGADGLWSKCRSSLLGHKDDPLPTGDLAYRIVLTLDQLDDSPDLKAWVSTPQCHLWAGPNAHAVGYSVRKGEMFNLVLLVPDDLPVDVSRQPGSVQEMKTLFKDWDPVLNRFLDHVEQVDKWKLMHRTELETWVNDQGTFVLIGDSCHNMLPYLAQDGAVLGALLSYVHPSSSSSATNLTLSQAMFLFQSLRKPRSEAIARETFLQRHQFHLVDGDEQMERDAVFIRRLGHVGSLQLGEEDVGEDDGRFPSRWTDLEVQSWIWGYDAYKEVEEAVKQVLGA